MGLLLLLLRVLQEGLEPPLLGRKGTDEAVALVDGLVVARVRLETPPLLLRLLQQLLLARGDRFERLCADPGGAPTTGGGGGRGRRRRHGLSLLEKKRLPLLGDVFLRRDAQVRRATPSAPVQRRSCCSAGGGVVHGGGAPLFLLLLLVATSNLAIGATTSACAVVVIDDHHARRVPAPAAAVGNTTATALL